jgi:hypothetical protein
MRRLIESSVYTVFRIGQETTLVNNVRFTKMHTAKLSLSDCSLGEDEIATK